MKKLTQKELILDYLKFNDVITPAKMTGRIHKGQMFGSEVSRVCRTLRANGKLFSVRDGKYEQFFLAPSKSAYDIARENREWKAVQRKRWKV